MAQQRHEREDHSLVMLNILKSVYACTNFCQHLLGKCQHLAVSSTQSMRSASSSFSGKLYTNSLRRSQMSQRNVRAHLFEVGFTFMF